MLLSLILIITLNRKRMWLLLFPWQCKGDRWHLWVTMQRVCSLKHQCKRSGPCKFQSLRGKSREKSITAEEKVKECRRNNIKTYLVETEIRLTIHLILVCHFILLFSSALNVASDFSLDFPLQLLNLQGPLCLLWCLSLQALHMVTHKCHRSPLHCHGKSNYHLLSRLSVYNQY